mmetsp:Transcript_10069/g.8864  ORF Transcript_10069/g.8864 Transcript_10069/m.8864 type:complete len:103 (+) Transcript_10069:675-983(+)
MTTSFYCAGCGEKNIKKNNCECRYKDYRKKEEKQVSDSDHEEYHCPWKSEDSKSPSSETKKSKEHKKAINSFNEFGSVGSNDSFESGVVERSKYDNPKKLPW